VATLRERLEVTVRRVYVSKDPACGIGARGAGSPKPEPSAARPATVHPSPQSLLSTSLHPPSPLHPSRPLGSCRKSAGGKDNISRSRLGVRSRVCFAASGLCRGSVCTASLALSDCLGPCHGCRACSQLCMRASAAVGRHPGGRRRLCTKALASAEEPSRRALGAFSACVL